jgi:NAD dependent epimerase/dehydratase family enzyme
MGELCSALGDVMSRPSFVPVPDFALNVLLGEGAQVVLEGQRVLPTKALEDGYEFKFAKVGDALRNLIA